MTEFRGNSEETTPIIKASGLREAGALICMLLPVGIGATTGYLTANGINNDRIRCHQDPECLVGKSSEASADIAGVAGGLAVGFCTFLAVGFVGYRPENDPNGWPG